MAPLPRSVAELTQLGLTTYEAKAYVALLGRDSFTAAQVSRQAGLPRQRIYDVLGSLVEKGLASSRPGSVVKYAAVAPELAVDRLVAEHRRGLDDLERAAARAISDLQPQYRTGLEHTDPLEYIEVLRDAGAINERFGELQASVKREILVFTKPPYATQPQENPEGLEVSRHVRARMQIAASYYRADSAKGLPFAQEVVTIEPDYPFGHYLLGLLYLDTRDVPHAIRELETAARMVPTEPQFQYSLASAYSRAGRTDDAARARAAFTRLGGTHPPGTGEGTERPRLELDRPQ